MAHTRNTSVSEAAAPRPAKKPKAPQAHRPVGSPAPYQRTSRGVQGVAVLLSLLIHALLLSLTFGGEGLGPRGLVFPWQTRRVEAPPLRIVLVPPQATPAKPVGEWPQQASLQPPVAAGAAPTPAKSSAPRLQARFVVLAPVVKPAPPPPQAEAKRNPVAPAPAPKRRAKAPDRPVPPKRPAPVAVAAAPPEPLVPVAPAVPVPPIAAVAVSPSASMPESAASASRGADDEGQAAQRLEAARQESARVEAARWEAERQEAAARLAAAQLETQRQEAARQEAARVEAARLEAERQDAAQQVAAAQLQAQRQEAARQQMALAEAARLETERQDAARRAAAQLEVQRQEAARQEAERQEAARQAAARQEAARVEAARLEGERQEAARQATARQEASRLEAEQAAAVAKREALLRAIGRQLDEEAARRDAAAAAARQPNTLPLSLSTARRVRLWGRTDPNAELVQYAEAWARRIQFNTAVETVRDVAKRPHTPPMVTVAIRSDGSVESVTFGPSSGVPEIDATIRRIIENQKPYPAFPPVLAREVDVIEIRRTWYFDSAVRLY